ncbi:MAG: hypothetical protein LUH05_05945 [Candidatus Gastranaerophilales bacterium]|nr:hypothetical protein [Candidatus Gastranaerophilales bacterium]
MKFYDDIEFRFTLDNSVGLYDKITRDIFHSETGALKEANEKFVNPLEVLIKNLKSDKICVLDICYGTGYNSKAFLIKYCGKGAHIDALEYNQNYACLSPFIFDTINDDDLKIFILSQLYSSKINPEKIMSIIKEISDSPKREFFAPFTSRFNSLYLNNMYKSNPNFQNLSFLHNIYYNYISDNNKNTSCVNKYNNSKINFKFGDARKTISDTNNLYDVVFLDAFSPKLDPRLWTIDFLSLVKSKMKQNSLLVSYSKSVPFRSALKELGLFIGKTLINNIDMGTSASLNHEFIINPLDDYDYRLIETRSGITYKDKNLNLPPSDILNNRNSEAKKSDRISCTLFNKSNRIG